MLTSSLSHFFKRPISRNPKSDPACQYCSQCHHHRNDPIHIKNFNCEVCSIPVTRHRAMSHAPVFKGQYVDWESSEAITSCPE